MLYKQLKIDHFCDCGSQNDSANLEMSKIYQENVQSLCRLAQLFIDTLAAILQKRAKSLESFFSIPENAICSIL